MVELKKTILVVDDDPSLRETMADVLTDARYEAILACNGRDALVKLASMVEMPPCLMILDIRMPEMGGVELLQVLARSGQLLSLPVVVMSGHAHEAEGLGARKLVRKPVSLDVLLSVVRDICGAGVPGKPGSSRNSVSRTPR